MMREQLLFESPSLRIARYEHPPGRPHRDPAEEMASAFAVSYVERGAFHLRDGRRDIRMAAGALMVTHPGYAYSCRHAGLEPDDLCLAVVPSLETLEALAEGDLPSLASIPPMPRAPSRAGYGFVRLQARLGPGKATDGAAIESLALDLLAAASSGCAPGPPPFRPGQVAWYAPRIDAVREAMHAAPGDPHTLTSLARLAGMSPFHFARVFAALTSMPPHRYLVAVRLDAAHRRLIAGAGVTETALACGFPNLSHFTRTFRGRYGVPPSAAATSQESASVSPGRPATLRSMRRGAATAMRRRPGRESDTRHAPR